MKKPIKWKLVSAYLAIGLLWASFAATKQLEVQLRVANFEANNADKILMGLAVSTNALLWPVGIPLGVLWILDETVY